MSPIFPRCRPDFDCMPLVKCPQVTSSLAHTWTSCSLDSNYPGVCCPKHSPMNQGKTLLNYIFTVDFYHIFLLLGSYEFEIPLRYGFGGIAQFQTFGPDQPKPPG